jgi:hypothetical protein
MELCSICKKSNDQPLVCIGEKGSNGINAAASKRGDDLKTSPGEFVHAKCRQQYTSAFYIAKVENINVSDHQTKLRSQANFNFKTHCLFCGQVAKKDKKRSTDTCFVKSFEFQRNVIHICNERRDDWSTEIMGRIGSVNDLHAADALYHKSCDSNFRTKKSVPSLFSTNETPAKRGRPGTTNEYFQKIIDYVENNPDNQVTVNHLVSMMQDMCGDQAYTPKFMIKKLKDHFQENVVIFEKRGTAGVVTLRQAVSSILKDFYQRPKQNSTEEKVTIIRTAAKLIKSELMSLEDDKEFYPCSDQISSLNENLAYLPDGLSIFLHSVIGEKSSLKISSIGQAIMKSSRQRSFIPPLQLGLGVQIHHCFGSRSLVDTLFSLGFCLSYDEVKKYESSSAVEQGISIPGITDTSCLQFMADNVDHNIDTLDGNGTFHGMGIVAAITPSDPIKKKIPRLSATLEDVKSIAKINLSYYRSPTNRIADLSFNEFCDPVACDADSNLKVDIFLNIMWSLKSPMPGWSGVWQLAAKGEYPGKTAIVFLPMIDMNPSEPSCIFSTMQFVSKQASRYKCSPILTFDQPLYWKAFTIRENEEHSSPLKRIILRLGGFHMTMSYLGAVGHIMNGTGLHELFELIYANNTVPHLMSGKAYARAVRAHMLADTALYTHLVSKLDDSISVSMSDEVVVNLLDKLLRGDDVGNEIRENTTIATVVDKVSEKLQELANEGRTAALWYQYMEMIAILKAFIRGERTGNWLLHLSTVARMLPYLAAAGHNLYVKSSYIYLTEMLQLEREHPDVYNQFLLGHHSLRRSDRMWAGMSSDHMIEQVLMRSLKSSGGLTRGRGLSESQRSTWILAMPCCASINDAMNDITGTGFVTSEQHKESGHSRMDKDTKDIGTMVSFLKERDPFNDNPNLRNIETGVTAEASVNADNAKSVGQKIMQSLPGQNVVKYSFKRSMQIVPMNSRNSIKVDEDNIVIDPQLLFQRLASAANSRGEDLSEVLCYELSCVPPSLFDENGLMREAHKSSLAEYIWKCGDCSADNDGKQTLHVLDGGHLLHRIPWMNNENFEQIFDRYVSFVNDNYNHSTIVFDGYSDAPSTKDFVHLRRSKGICATEVFFDETTPFKTKKDVFLTNAKNKTRFIDFLGERLERHGHNVIYTEGDADYDIAKQAISLSEQNHVTVVGTDTDILILLCHFYDPLKHDLFFGGESQHNTTCRLWDIRKTISVIGEDARKVLPAIHSITGCDTTSRMFGIGKSAALKKIKTSQHFRENIEIFSRSTSTKEEIIQSGNEVVASLYGGIPNEGLNLLRYRKFGSKLATGSIAIQCHNLPPTSDSSALHIQRAHHQAHYWMTGEMLLATDWG